MKKYLQIEISGRGGIDDVKVVECDDVKSYVEKRFNEFVNDGVGEEDWEGYVDEFGSLDENDWGWFVGMGEEDYWFVVDMDSDLFVKWYTKNELYLIREEEWLNNEDLLYEFVDELDY